MCPGRPKSPGRDDGSTIARTVRARSSALIPVRHDRWSTGTVWGVWCGAVLWSTIGPNSSRAATSGRIGMQSSPRPCVIMNSTVSGVTRSAAATKSPSFSRSSSSTTMMIRPSFRAWTASSTFETSSCMLASWMRRDGAARWPLLDIVLQRSRIGLGWWSGSSDKWQVAGGELRSNTDCGQWSFVAAGPERARNTRALPLATCHLPLVPLIGDTSR